MATSPTPSLPHRAFLLFGFLCGRYGLPAAEGGKMTDISTEAGEKQEAFAAVMLRAVASLVFPSLCGVLSLDTPPCMSGA